MESLLIRERYKAVRVITLRPGYALLEAVDISKRETPSLLLNLYEGEHLRRYAKIFSAIRPEDCPAFRGMFLERGALVTVFDRSEGESIDRYFYRGDAWSLQDRLSYTELLLHGARRLSVLPPDVSCAALLSENVLIDPNNRRVAFRWAVWPMADMNPRETALLAADQAKKILPRTLSAGEAERAFLAELDSGLFQNPVALYGCWRKAKPAIESEREEFEKKSLIRRAGILLGRSIRRRAEQGGQR